MRSKRQQAVTSAEATASKNIRQSLSYQSCAPKASENLQDQLGLLLWQLQSPLSKHQRKVGWSLLGVLLSQYVTIKEGAL